MRYKSDYSARIAKVPRVRQQAACNVSLLYIELGMCVNDATKS